MHRLPYPLIALLPGLILAQAVAAVFVHLSDMHLYDQTRAMAAAGFLTVPNDLVLPSLTKWGPALSGGIFFSLSVGAALSVGALVAAWIYDRVLRRRRLGLAVLAAGWVVLMVLIQRRWFSWPLALFFLLVPPPVFWAALKLMPPASWRRAWPVYVSFILPIALMGGTWGAMTGKGLFLDLRDYLLWSNPAGRSMISFYYQYTLHPAEAFKSLRQKTIRPVSLLGEEGLEQDRVKKELVRLGWLPVQGDGPADLEVRLENGLMTLGYQGLSIMAVDLERFLAAPAETLDQFSELTDRHRLLRRTVLVSMLAGVPLFLYVVFFQLFYGLAGLWPRITEGRRAMLAALLCLAVGLGLLGPILYGRSLAEQDVKTLLASDSWWRQTAGLKIVAGRQMDLAGYPDWQRFEHVRAPSVRYWLAKSLAYIRTREAGPMLVRLLDDPEPNVACLAAWSMGRRGGNETKPALLKKIRSSDHWYVQWYIYHSLRRLGWTQSVSTD